MTKITLQDMENRMREYNRRHPERAESADISAIIVFKQGNWDKEYPEISRMYRVWNCNRGYQDGKISNSVFMYCLDGTDQGVRFDWYNWAVDYCFMVETADELYEIY